MISFTQGQLVYSKAGHDKGKIYVIIKMENEYLYLADGKIRKLDNLKKKKIKHIQPTKYIDEDICKKIAGENVTDEEIKRVIKIFNSKNLYKQED